MKSALQLLTTLALFAAIFHFSAGGPIAACGTNQFVADDRSLCIFYQCSHGKAYEFACSKGTRVPSYYLAGDANPCTIKIKTSVFCPRCDVTDDRIPGVNVSNQCAKFQPCATRPGCTCIDQVAGYYCSCPVVPPSKPVPTPESKPVAACDVNVCKNGGTCSQLYKNKFCNCPPPYTGRFCESNACDDIVCNNGVCVYDSKGVYCQCEPCFTGTCCENVRVDILNCSNCSNCYGGADCKILREHLCECNPCPNKTDVCTNTTFGKGPRSCVVPPTTASHTFTLMFEDNDSDPPEALEVYVSAALVDGTVRNVVVDAPLNPPNCSYSESADIPPANVHKFNVRTCLKHRTTSKKSFGIRVREINKLLVNVYCINRAKYSADGWLALPDTVAGKLFTAISYSPAVTNSQVGFVAIEDGTIVHVYLSNPSYLIRGSDTNGHLVVNLDAYETYLVQAYPFDLTGTVVQSNKPIHVYSGEGRGWVGPSTSNPDYNSTQVTAYSKSRDVLIIECPSVSEWGSTFAIVPLPRNMIGYNFTEELVRVVGTKPTSCDLYTTPYPNATVQQTTMELNAYPYWTQFYIVADNNYFLACSNPVQIAEITESSLNIYRIPKNDGSEDPYFYYNDPSFIFVPSVASYSNFFRFLPPDFSVTGGPYLFTYVRIIANESDYQGILLNDQPLYPTPPPANEIVKPWRRIYVPKGSPAKAYPSLFATIFRLSSTNSSMIHHPTSKVRFMAIVEGFDDRESYGFPLGADMFKLHFESDAILSAVVAAPHPSPVITVE